MLVKRVLDESSHPKIRFSAYHIIGQMCDDQKGSFQYQHSYAILSLLIAGLDEEVPRLKGHCIAAIINFMDGIEKQMAVEFCPMLLPKIIQLISPGNSLFIIENGLSALS